MCADGIEALVPNGVFRNTGRKDNDDKSGQKENILVPRNGILYKDRNRCCHMCTLFVSETEFDRSMSWLGKGAKTTRTITFPDTIRTVKDDAFKDNRSLRSAVLNEGLGELKG